MRPTIELNEFVKAFGKAFPTHVLKAPWNITRSIEALILEKIKGCSDGYQVNGNIAIHKTATIEEGVVLKGPIVVSEQCFIAAHAYLRAGVFLGKNVTIGPGSEVKSSIILDYSALAHFNFAGDSIIGSRVNLEAGSILANFHNDRDEKEIFVAIQNTLISSGVQKFGSLIGDDSKIGANAVLSPGTILPPKSIVHRLELVKQC
jgi:UDP-N-acetylglucosamine diphosphorylase / glucose-1-phosphate thymidylyltransferase / UDP-N-acetylgalactosamine diphosphorylase / glucosamine-1-phosphate N-acetyltransferase / galactosamine-1-phosphate N-acetyltransferase